MKRCFSDQTSLGHAAAQLENMTKKPNEPLRLSIFRYSKIHKSVMKRDACYDTDPSRWFRFLTTITNTTISDQTSLGHAATQLENMTQKPNEPLRLYTFRYSKIHKSVMKRDASYDTDPSRSFRFLTSIINTTIADKITRSEFLPQNLQQCFEKALRLEASLQLSEGVNMA